MFKKKDNIVAEKVETLIGQGSSFKGELSSEGSIRVDGRFEGSVESKLDVIVGDKGIVQASINARNLLVAGEITGNIKAQGRLEILSTGKVLGDVDVQNIVIEEGAVFKGNCTMQSSNA